MMQRDICGFAQCTCTSIGRIVDTRPGQLLASGCVHMRCDSVAIVITILILRVAVQSEVEAGKVALEQAEMAAVVAATECINMQKVCTIV